ncbi:hypothetical protein GJ744_004014 [Endocarpon pusillum]|uniref:Uncharacterized protein n=1 Tax=Endocarpon pusillum TaxID=364733 RepID=A0A8H7DZ17_9EURO|nr:hypothetical protein GJ744_004014 [Endocarpon pusillum]
MGQSTIVEKDRWRSAEARGPNPRAQSLTEEGSRPGRQSGVTVVEGRMRAAVPVFEDRRLRDHDE